MLWLDRELANKHYPEHGLVCKSNLHIKTSCILIRFYIIDVKMNQSSLTDIIVGIDGQNKIHVLRRTNLR